MSTREDRQGRLVKARAVRRSGKPVRIGGQVPDRSDSSGSGEGPSVRAEKDDDGRVAALIVTCPCGETIRINCHYSREDDHDAPQA